MLKNLNCKKLQKWEFIVDAPGQAGHACGIPDLLSPHVPAYLLDVARHLKEVGCSKPTMCHTAACDPYKSVFKTRFLCFPKIRKPNIENWKTDKAFVEQFLHVNDMQIDNLVHALFLGS